MDIGYPLPMAIDGKFSVILKFNRRPDRKAIFFRRIFADTGISVIKSLTKKRLDLLHKDKSLLGKELVWTFNENIYDYLNSKRMLTQSRKDLHGVVAEL